MTCRLNFTQESPAFKAHVALLAAGVSDDTIDKDHNHILDELEVITYAVENYEEYRTIVEGINRGPIPWVLDDYDPSTDFDEKIRRRVAVEIAIIDGLLHKQNFPKTSDDYKVRMAVGLFYWAYADHDPQKLVNNKGFLKKSQELEDLGLTEFRNHLLQSGGLGVSKMKKNTHKEATAIESLRTSWGACTEKSKILFAIYWIAGLKSQFVKLTWKDSRSAHKINREVTTPDGVGDSHAAIALPLKNKVRFFDLTYHNSNRRFASYQLLSLTQYLSGDVSNRVQGYLLENQVKKAHSQALLAIMLDPKNSQAYSNLGNINMKLNSLGEAEEALNKASKIDPYDPTTIGLLGVLYFLKNDYKSSERFIKKAIELEPKFAVAYSNLAVLYLNTKRLADGFDKVQMAIWLNAKLPEPYMNMAEIAIRLQKSDAIVSELKSGLQQLKDATTNQSALAAAHSALGSTYVKSELYDAAILEFEAAVTQDPKNMDLIKELKRGFVKKFFADPGIIQFQNEIGISAAELSFALSILTIAWGLDLFGDCQQISASVGTVLQRAIEFKISFSAPSKRVLTSLLMRNIEKMPDGLKLYLSEQPQFKEVFTSLGINLDLLIWP